MCLFQSTTFSFLLTKEINFLLSRAVTQSTDLDEMIQPLLFFFSTLTSSFTLILRSCARDDSGR